MRRFFWFFTTRFAGAALIALGITNEWILTRALSPDGIVENSALQVSLWAFDVACILGGSLLFTYGNAAPDFAYAYLRPAAIVGFGVLSGLWVAAVTRLYNEWGLFRWMANDYGIYLAQANVLRSGDPRGIYSVEALQGEYQQLYDGYPSLIADAAPAANVPYPPLFAWLLGPFTHTEPHVGFIVWTLLNGVGGLYLVWRATQFFSKQEKYLVGTCLLTSYAFVYSLITGQPTLLLACAVAGFYLGLRAGKDFLAGLFLSLLFFKPHYGALLGPLLIWKKRWGAVAGAGTGAVAILAGSVAVAGLPMLLTYPQSLTEMATFRGDVPAHMINWRALILWMLPDISDWPGLMLELVLSGLTVLATALAWRGPWLPRERSFPLLMALTILATLLTNHHSLQYGAVLLAVPLAAAIAQGGVSHLTRFSVFLACLLPAVSFTFAFSLDAAQASRLMMACLAVCFAGLLADCLRARGAVIPGFVARRNP